MDNAGVLYLETRPFGVILAVDGELDAFSAPRLRHYVRMLAPPRGWVMVDLSQLRFCDAAGVRALLEAHRELTGKAVDVVMISPHDDQVRRVLSVSGLNDRVPIYGTVHAAKHAWARRAANMPLTNSVGESDLGGGIDE